VLAPVIAVVVGIVVGMLQLLMVAITLSFHGVNVWQLLLLAHPFRVMFNLIGYIPLYALWAAPAVGWLLICSAWARSKPFLWAVALPSVAGIVIGWFNLLGTIDVSNSWYWRNVVARLLGSVFPGGWLTQLPQVGGDNLPETLSSLGILHTYAVLGSTSVWVGVAAAIAMLTGAIWFRRWRDDS
jgi:ABC-2 type transport system permease protein